MCADAAYTAVADVLRPAVEERREQYEEKSKRRVPASFGRCWCGYAVGRNVVK